MRTGDRIRAIEEEIRATPYNKATQHHIGKLKAKIARLREEAEKRGRRKGGRGYSIKKGGDATVVLAGFPSVGKSTLLNKLTNAQSKVGTYDFTTLNVIPGVMEYRGARFQILDIPGMIGGASSGKGRGREVLSVVRAADLILLIVDVFNLQQLDVLKNELYEVGIRLDKKPVDVKINKRGAGGISVSSTVKLTKIGENTIEAILNEYRIHNADVVVREDVTLDELLDAVAGNRIYIPSLTLLNKIDLVRGEYLNEVRKKCIPISAEDGINLEVVKQAMFEKLEFIRIYLKPQDGDADLNRPMIVVKGSRVGDICDRMHSKMREDFRYAKVTGSSVKFKNQRVGLEHVLRDGDVLTIL